MRDSREGGSKRLFPWFLEVFGGILLYRYIVGSEEQRLHGPWKGFAQAFLIDPKKKQWYIRNFSSLAQSKTSQSMFFQDASYFSWKQQPAVLNRTSYIFPMAASDLFQARKLGEDGTHS